MGKIRRSRVATASLFSLALVAAACGGGDAESSSATVDAQLQSELGKALAAGPDAQATDEPVELPESMEAWEELWAEQRAAIVARAEENGWGLSADGTTVTGPGGFTIDLGACPAGWSNTEGLTDTSIRIGFTGPLSGPLAETGNMLRAMGALYDHYNEAGGFPDATSGGTRTVEFVTRDDAYDPARTIPLVDELIDSQKVFAAGTVGTPNQLKVFGKLNERCVPHPAISGDYSVGDPVGHPWTTSSSLSYVSEAVLLGQFVEQRLDSDFGGKAKVAVLRLSNDFGEAFEGGLEGYLAESPRGGDIELVTQVVEAAAPSHKDAMTTLAAEQPDVFIASLAGTACAQAVTEAAENGMKDDVAMKVLGSNCRGATKAPDMAPLLDTWLSVGGGYRDMAAPANDDDAWMVFARDLMAGVGLDHRTAGALDQGLYYAWYEPQALLIAGQLPGGLTRTNFVLALRMMDMTHPHLVPGVKFNMDGGDDVFFVEGSDISSWDVATRSWVVESVVDVSGKTKPCSWDTAALKCR